MATFTETGATGGECERRRGAVNGEINFRQVEFVRQSGDGGPKLKNLNVELEKEMRVKEVDFQEVNLKGEESH